MTLVELMIAASVLVIGLLGFMQVIAMSAGASTANQESNVAIEAARQKIEEIQVADFASIFALYNTSANDDPGGVGTAPGGDFAVLGLDPVMGDPDGMAGEIVLPATTGLTGALELRENLVDASLGTPRDLNGDGLIDQLDHSADYGVIPVLVRVRWRGARGNAQMEFKTLVATF
jgi:type II secretory pathway pseudopilin PulG